jgi:nicotinamidase-related amidase
MSQSRHPNLLHRQNTCLLIIDVQERFRAHIVGFAEMVKSIAVLVKVANILGLPIVLTEQNPQKLGATVKEILAEIDVPIIFAKNSFSCCEQESFAKHIEQLERKQILVTGIETHVCVNQSVHNLLYLGYQVHIAADAVSSRQLANKRIGIKKMLSAGAIISSTELATLELLETADNPQFKQIQGLIK